MSYGTKGPRFSHANTGKLSLHNKKDMSINFLCFVQEAGNQKMFKRYNRQKT